MAKVLQQLMRRTLYRGKGNLYCLDDPYHAMEQVLAGHSVKGIVDAGASDGGVSRRLLKRFPQAQAYQFEPNPMYRERLAKLSQEDKRCHPFGTALSDEPGELELYQTALPGRTSIFKPNSLLNSRYPEGTVVQGKMKVPVTTLDRWWDQEGRPEVQLLKSDIQGGELRMLRGAGSMLSTCVLAIYMEVFLNPLYEDGALYSEIDLLVREHGFALFNLYAPRHDPSGTGMLLWAHALYVHREKLGF